MSMWVLLSMKKAKLGLGTGAYGGQSSGCEFQSSNLDEGYTQLRYTELNMQRYNEVVNK